MEKKPGQKFDAKLVKRNMNRVYFFAMLLKYYRYHVSKVSFSSLLSVVVEDGRLKNLYAGLPKGIDKEKVVGVVNSRNYFHEKSK